MVSFYVKTREGFVCLIIQDRYWVVHIIFFLKVKYTFLAQFPVNHLAHPTVHSSYSPSVLICCIRLLCDWLFRLYHHMPSIYCFVIIILFLESFSNQVTLMVFLRSLSESKYPQFSRTLLCILPDLNSVTVWMSPLVLLFLSPHVL